LAAMEGQLKCRGRRLAIGIVVLQHGREDLRLIGFRYGTFRLP
jgi:hypothetical protein